MPLAVLAAGEIDAALAAASSDIRFHFDGLLIDQDIQVAIYHGGFTSLRLFTALDESATKVRACLKDDFGMDPATGLAMRRQVALVIAAWESGREQIVSEDRAKMEARSNHFPRPVGVTEHAAMRAAVEAKLGTLRNYEVPSKALIGQKLEQVEQNEMRLEDFREVTSIDDGEVEFLSSAVDSTGAIKVRRGSAGGSLPDNPEDLRLRHKRIALAWAFVATKHCNRPWLKHFQIDVYRKLSDHILGKEVAGLVVMASDSTVLLKPSWLQVLRYDSEVRKHAYESIRSGAQATISEAVESSCKDVRILQLHLLNPLTLEGNARSKGYKRRFDQGGDQGEDTASRGNNRTKSKVKGLGKGSGSGGKGSGKKGKRGKGQLFSEIPRSGEVQRRTKVLRNRMAAWLYFEKLSNYTSFSNSGGRSATLGPPVLSEGFRRNRIVQEDEISEDSFGIQSEAKPFLCIDGASSVQETVCTGGSSSSVLESKLESTTGQIFRVLYLFTCRKRKAEVWWYLQKLCVRHKVRLDMQEYDLGKGEELKRESDWERVQRRIEGGAFDLVFCTPPSGDFSRAQWTKRKGPLPTRSRHHPLGYPWLKGGPERKTAFTNFLYERTMGACTLPDSASRGPWADSCRRTGFNLATTGYKAVGSGRERGHSRSLPVPLAKGQHETTYTLMGTVTNLRSIGHAGWPAFTKRGHYAGPLPRRCGHNHSVSKGVKQAENLRVAPSAGFPAQMCTELADLFLEDFLLHTTVVDMYLPLHLTLTPTGGELGLESAPQRQVLLKSASQVEAEEAESDLDEDGVPKPKYGAGLWGSGPPLSFVESGKHKLFSDGCGLCSPGRWEPARRQVVGSSLAEEVRVALLKVLYGKLCVKKVLYQLACNQFTGSPFGEELLAEGVKVFISLLRKHGAAEASAEVPLGQPVLLPALENFLKLCGDPDSRVFHTSSRSFSKGVTLGILGKLPRVPAVFDRKERWRKYPEDEGDPEDGENYGSARDNLDSIKKQFEEERDLGAMREVLESDARKEYGDNLLIAPIGAIEKADATFRVIHDGTHKVKVNPRIRARDQHKCPGSGELKSVMRSSGDCKSVFGLTGDVRRAHRLPRVRRAEWGLQACKLSGDTVWLNEVGTFGMGPAAYHWAREASGLGRACIYLMQNRWFYQLLYADDFNWISTGAFAVDDIMLAVFLLCVLGVPMSWKKFHGGLQYEWVGYWADLRHRRLGISEGRAQWLVRWMTNALAAGTVNVEEFKSVLGRMGFAMRALETFRPFLGPLYAWSSAVPRHINLELPAMVRLILSYLKDRLKEGSRTAPAGSSQGATRELFRADAKAEGEEVCIGGWECQEAGEVSSARWFSETITRANAPWVFEAGEPFRTIATLELLATLCCLVAFPRDPSLARPEEPRALLTLGGSTDNLGNKFVVSKLQTTKYPLVCVLMEIAALLHQAGESLDLQWVPRLQNIEADQLTNGDYRGFDPAKRVRVDIAKHRWVVLNSMLQQGRALYSVIRKGRIESSKRKLDKLAGPS
ncbi:unnamed protein product [Polarella glacialis]|uniref:Uncharacterized protein n=1 Tax=Polarella glacialis TaxID=89957 RepID=A0A813LLY0_POLGL|nr:unnamed protein product [Polarella glacialis]